MGDDEDEYVVVLEKVVENDEQRDLELEDYYGLAIHDKDFVLGDSFEHEPVEKKLNHWKNVIMKYYFKLFFSWICNVKVPAVDEDFDELDNVDY